MLYLILIVILAEAVYQTLYYRTSKEALRSHISFYILCALFFSSDCFQQHLYHQIK